MDNQNAVMVIVAVCAAILLIGALKRQKEWLINLLFRTVTGTLGIFFINLGLANWGMQSTIGINTVTVLTTAILGFPGLFLLYGIHFYNNMRKSTKNDFSLKKPFTNDKKFPIIRLTSETASEYRNNLIFILYVFSKVYWFYYLDFFFNS